MRVVVRAGSRAPTYHATEATTAAHIKAMLVESRQTDVSISQQQLWYGSELLADEDNLYRRRCGPQPLHLVLSVEISPPPAQTFLEDGGASSSSSSGGVSEEWPALAAGSAGSGAARAPNASGGKNGEASSLGDPRWTSGRVVEGGGGVLASISSPQAGKTTVHVLDSLRIDIVGGGDEEASATHTRRDENPPLLFDLRGPQDVKVVCDEARVTRKGDRLEDPVAGERASACHCFVATLRPKNPLLPSTIYTCYVWSTPSQNAVLGAFSFTTAPLLPVRMYVKYSAPSGGRSQAKMITWIPSTDADHAVSAFREQVRRRMGLELKEGAYLGLHLMVGGGGGSRPADGGDVGCGGIGGGSSWGNNENDGRHDQGCEIRGVADLLRLREGSVVRVEIGEVSAGPGDRSSERRDHDLLPQEEPPPGLGVSTAAYRERHYVAPEAGYFAISDKHSPEEEMEIINALINSVEGKMLHQHQQFGGIGKALPLHLQEQEHDTSRSRAAGELHEPPRSSFDPNDPKHFVIPTQIILPCSKARHPVFSGFDVGRAMASSWSKPAPGGHCRASSTPHERDHLEDDLVRAAWKKHGYVVVSLPPDVDRAVQGSIDAAEQFFALPSSEKKRYNPGFRYVAFGNPEQHPPPSIGARSSIRTRREHCSRRVLMEERHTRQESFPDPPSSCCTS